MAKKTSREGLIEIASHEGIVTSKYLDSVGVWTIGIGHTAGAGAPNPANVTGELSIAEIMDIFAADIAKFEKRVNRAFTVPLKQHQFDAAVSFDYNTGSVTSAAWVKQYNAGNVSAARKSIMNWKKPPEIIPRRKKEQALFFDGVYSANGYANMYPARNGKVQWGEAQRVNVASLMDLPTQPQEPYEPPTTPETTKSPLWRILGGLWGIAVNAFKLFRKGKS